MSLASNTTDLAARVRDEFNAVRSEIPAIEIANYFNGSTVEATTFAVTSDGATVLATFEKSGGGDINILFNSVPSLFDATPIASVALTAGSDSSPQINFVYIPQSTNVLTAATNGWPSEQYAPVGTVLVQSAASVQTDGAYKVHAWSDHLADGSNNGHSAHLNYWIRQQPATWVDGVALTPTAGAAQLDVSTSSGTVLQLHDHNFPAFNTATGSSIYVINHPDGAYAKVGSLTQADGVDKDVNGTVLGGASSDFYNLVLWGVVNEADADEKLMVNLPDGVYNSDTGGKASNDDQNTAIYTIPTEYTGVGFLIARLTIQETAGTYTVIQNEDLRGLKPSTSAGGSATGGTEFADNVFRIQDELDVTKEVAFQASGITTGTTRTITVPNADVDLAGIATNAADITTIEGEQTTQNAAIALNTAKTGVTTEEANPPLVSQAAIEAGTDTAEVTVSPLRIAQAIAALGGGGGGGGIIVYKTADETRVSTTTFADDTDLTVSVEANGIYEFRQIIIHKSATTPDMKIGHSYPVGTEVAWQDRINGARDAKPETSTLYLVGYGSTYTIAYHLGIILVGGTAGSFSLRWAQNTSSTVATTLKKGSMMKLTKLN